MSSSKLNISVLIVAVCIASCSGEEAGQVDVYEVSGKITMGGGPLPNASVIFSPQEQQPVATGRTNASGEFTLTTYESGDGAAAGNYVVLLNKSDAPSGAAAPTSSHNATGAYTPPAHSGPRGAAQGGSTLPARYSDAAKSDLKATVTEDGDNVFNFELKL